MVNIPRLQLFTRRQDKWLSQWVNRILLGLSCVNIITSWTSEAKELCYLPTMRHLDYIAPHPNQFKGPKPDKLRIATHYTESFKRISISEEIKVRLIEPALDVWREVLVAKKPYAEKYLAGRSCDEDGWVTRSVKEGYKRGCRNGCAKETKCSGITVPDMYLRGCTYFRNNTFIAGDIKNPGILGADYLLLVDVSGTEECRKVDFVYADLCQIEEELNRPTLGALHICPEKISLTYPYFIKTKNSIIHAVAHALGFHPILYAFMRDEKGVPRTPRSLGTNEPGLGEVNGYFRPNPTTMSYINFQWKSALKTINLKFWALKTPNLVAVARRHFGCTEIEGVYLEDHYSPHPWPAHFEKWLTNDELMTADPGFEGVVSELTLAFFKDTGWYDVKMDKAQPLSYGKGLGCDFVLKSCYEYIHIRKANGSSPAPYCTKPYTSGASCVPHKRAYGYCGLRHHMRPLPQEYQYFTSIQDVSSDWVHFFGGDLLMNYCPAPRPFIASTPTGYCGYEENNKYLDPKMNYHMESYGEDSICINHVGDWKTYALDLEEQNLVRTSRQVEGPYDPEDYISPFHASCHKIICSEQSGLIILMEHKGFACPLDGGTISLNTVGSRITVIGEGVCPPCKSVCKVCPRSTKVTKVLPTFSLINETAYSSSHRLPSVVMSINGLVFLLCMIKYGYT
ncbi:unnamed protein product [Calicophoron daubneyi]|uniref:Leishmanolysin-like peptidase n=1 Tax=Calicophoron daubneyi TaxID=300641 RepID=A0AAV2TMJ0_CALDB